VTNELKILTLNIASPSRKRAEQILEWLDGRDDDLFVLTETRETEGTLTIIQRFQEAGWAVRRAPLDQGERGVMLASRVALDPPGPALLSYLPSRAETATVSGADIDVIGVYIPSRDHTEAKTDRKRRFVDELAGALAPASQGRTVFIGDLNIVEPDHWPRHSWFHDWEYGLYTGLLDNGWVDSYRANHNGMIEHSWISADGDGYRFDHALVTGALGEGLRCCRMLHEPRETRISDHSALELRLSCDRTQPLSIDNSLTSDPLALF
jgi:exodeoxyribonuclease III